MIKEYWDRMFNSKYNPELSLEKILGENGLVKKLKNSKLYEPSIDTFANISYSYAVGTVMDSQVGLSFTGSLASRGFATIVNSLTGGIYGKYRDFAYKITKTYEGSPGMKKIFTDLGAFNTFQVPIYASAVAIGDLISTGSIDFAKVRDGALYLTMISPLIAPTMGWYMNKNREFFGLETSEEKAKQE